LAAPRFSTSVKGRPARNSVPVISKKLGVAPSMSTVSLSLAPRRATSGRPSTIGGTMICAATSRIDLASAAMAAAISASRGLRWASRSDAGLYGSPARWNAKTFSVPSSLNRPAMPLRTPTRIVATSTTVMIPITMPAMARAERSFWLRSESIASRPASELRWVQVTSATPPSRLR
jgi:hypothetical protein